MIPVTPAVSPTASSPMNEISAETTAVDPSVETGAVPFSELLQTLRPTPKKMIVNDGASDSLPECLPPSPALQIVEESQTDQEGVGLIELLPVPISTVFLDNKTVPVLPEGANLPVVDLAVQSDDSLDASLLMPTAFSEGGDSALKRDVAASDLATMTARLAVPVGHPAWSGVLGQRLQLAMQQQTNSIQIRLDPPELGQLDVQIQVDGSDTQVVFHTEQREVKEALERAFPRLHEMLSLENDSGLGFQFGEQHTSQFDGLEEWDELDVEGESERVPIEDVRDQSQKSTGLLSAIDFYV